MGTVKGDISSGGGWDMGSGVGGLSWGGDTPGDGARAHPGLASTVATRELAQLWRSLSPDERRPYWYWYILVHTG